MQFASKYVLYTNYNLIYQWYYKYTLILILNNIYRDDDHIMIVLSLCRKWIFKIVQQFWIVRKICKFLYPNFSSADLSESHSRSQIWLKFIIMVIFVFLRLSSSHLHLKQSKTICFLYSAPFNF